MKLNRIAICVLAAISSQAYALTPAEIADNGTVKVYMSGASALRNIIGGLFTQNCTTDISEYRSAIGTFSGTPFNSVGDAHRVYACTMRATSAILPGKKVALFKSDVGGSGQGVFPVFFGAIAPFPTRNFLSTTVAGCTARVATVPNYTCTGETAQVPMVGISDVEPALFKGINVPGDDPTYPSSGLDAIQLGDLTVTPLFQTVFGVAVNTSLRNALQTRQSLVSGSELEADRPSMSRIEAASYFNGFLQDPANGSGWQAIVSATDSKRDTRVNVCRRVNGSGTQASANAFLTQFPCNTAVPQAPLVYADSAVPGPNATITVGPSTAQGGLFVFEGSTTGNVISCLAAAETTGAYAIGHVSRENGEAGTNWRHVRVDGITPSRDNVRNGKYEYFFESTLQWHNAKFATLSADQQAFLTSFRDEAQRPSSLALLSTAAQNGVAALPSSYSGAFGTGSAAEIAFGSRVSRGGNSCQTPFLAK